MKNLLLIFLLLPFLGIAQNAKSKPGNRNHTDTLKVSGILKVTSGSPGNGKVFVSDADGNGSWGVSIIEGTGTPILTVVSNITGTPTVTTSYYQRVGDVIEQWGEITFDPTTTSTATELRISLLVPTSISNTYQLVGSAASNTLNEIMNITGDVTNGAAVIKCTVVDISSRTVSYRFKYKFLEA